jgi:hypothetical protein
MNGAICSANFADGIASLGVRCRRDRAGVDHHDVCGVAWRRRIAAAEQLMFQRSSIRLRGAASKLFDIKSRHGIPIIRGSLKRYQNGCPLSAALKLTLTRPTRVLA